MGRNFLQIIIHCSTEDTSSRAFLFFYVDIKLWWVKGCECLSVVVFVWLMINWNTYVICTYMYIYIYHILYTYLPRNGGGVLIQVTRAGIYIQHTLVATQPPAVLNLVTGSRVHPDTIRDVEIAKAKQVKTLIWIQVSWAHVPLICSSFDTL